MLARDVTVEDFDSADWIRVGQILRGPRGLERARASARPSGGLVLIADGTHVRKVFHTRDGRIDPARIEPGAPLGELARAHGASWVVRIHPGALRLFSARVGLRLERPDDLESQILKLVTVVRELEAEGALELYPSGMHSVPIPSARAMKLFWDAVCPVGKSIFVAAFDGSDLSTSVAVHRGSRGFDRIVGPERIRGDTGLRSGDWRQNSRGVARAAELAVGPLAVGAFAEEHTWVRLIRDRTPGTWAAAVAARDVVFHPIAPALAIPLGIDVGRVAWALARDLADRFGAYLRSVERQGPF
jgi:hypothetical protein